MVTRTIEVEMKKWLKSHHSFTIYGARQVGKTTLVKKFAQDSGLNFKYVDCDRLISRESLENDTNLKEFIGETQLLILDQAQRVKNIGLIMKIIHDNIPDVKVIATGSSALDLASEIKEPMTGRDFNFNLYPLSINELSQKYSQTEITYRIEELLLFGSYPDVINSYSNEIKEKILYSLSQNYLYKDILELDLIKKTSLLVDLLRVLAFSIGSEVTNYGLAEKLSIKSATVERYLDLLEQCFIIKKIRPFNRKITNEIKHPYKIYFWDLGIRNALIEDFKPLNLRDDRAIGGLWENFCIIERIKKMQNTGRRAKHYFWRTNEASSKEYDLIEEVSGDLTVFEIKWGKSGANKVKKYPLFFNAYPGSNLNTINKENCISWLN
ncbi:MAG: AAA family ATPase [bacterium]